MCLDGMSSVPEFLLTLSMLIMAVIVIVAVAVAVSRMWHEVNDETYTTILQPLCQLLQRNIWVLKVVQGHANRYQVEVLELWPGELGCSRVSKKICLVASHLRGHVQCVGVAVEFIHHVIGDIDPDDSGQERRQRL